MIREATKSVRPTSGTLISIFEIYGALIGFYYIFRLGAQELGVASTLLFALGGTVSFGVELDFG